MHLFKNLIFVVNIFFIYLLSIGISFADLQEDIINKITATKTLSFDFKQTISEKEETGKCFIKYPLMMRCNYQNRKQKTVISNGKKVAVIKRKYKKIYYYPIRLTPLFFILKKEKIISVIRENNPIEIGSDWVGFEFIAPSKSNAIVFFEKNSLNFKGWETKDIYSNNVTFIIDNLRTNDQIMDDFFNIPKEENL